MALRTRADVLVGAEAYGIHHVSFHHAQDRHDNNYIHHANHRYIAQPERNPIEPKSLSPIAQL